MSFHSFYMKKIEELSARFEGEEMPKLKAKNFTDVTIFIAAALILLAGIIVILYQLCYIM